MKWSLSAQYKGNAAVAATSHHRLRRSLSSRRILWVSALTNYRYLPRLIPASTYAPVAADSAAGRQGVRSTTEGEIFKGTDGACADPDTQSFPCHGDEAMPPASFISLTFRPKPVLWYFLDSRKYRPLPLPLALTKKLSPETVASAGERDACVKA